MRGLIRRLARSKPERPSSILSLLLDCPMIVLLVDEVGSNTSECRAIAILKWRNSNTRHSAQLLGHLRLLRHNRSVSTASFTCGSLIAG